jgi:hypothetical protein
VADIRSRQLFEISRHDRHDDCNADDIKKKHDEDEGQSTLGKYGINHRKITFGVLEQN